MSSGLIEAGFWIGGIATLIGGYIWLLKWLRGPGNNDNYPPHDGGGWEGAI